MSQRFKLGHYPNLAHPRKIVPQEDGLEETPVDGEMCCRQKDLEENQGGIIMVHEAVQEYIEPLSSVIAQAAIRIGTNLVLLMMSLTRSFLRLLYRV
jgi:hypothetical protein